MNWENVTRLSEFDTPTVANGLEMLGLMDPTVGYTGPDVRALMPEMGVRVGIAVTARMDTTTAGTDNPTSLFRQWLEAMVAASKSAGDGTRLPVIAVMESVGPKPRYTVTIGDGMGTAMKLAGAVGFVTNGSIRDLEGVRNVPLPCWAAGLSPQHGKLRWIDIGSPVCIDGMWVRNGDVLHADVNGVLTIPGAQADKVLEKAQLVRERESTLFARIQAPGYTIERYFSGQ